MSLAFLILAHKNPAQLARLANALEAPGHSVFVHVDARQPEVLAQARTSLGPASAVHFVEPGIACRWGGYSVVEATLAGLRAVRAAGVGAQHIVLMSGQDYPLVSNHTIDAFFAQHPGRQFIEAFALDEPNRWTHHRGSYQASRRIHAFHIPLRSRWLMLPVDRPLPDGLVGHGGAQWWALTSDCAFGLLDMLQRQPAIEPFFRHTFIPDESLFHTLLMNSAWRTSVDQRNLRYVDFTRANPTAPAVLTVDDLDVLYAEPDVLIARKFDTARDEAVLDVIDLRRPGAAMRAPTPPRGQ
jgi:hypothetical protein